LDLFLRVLAATFVSCPVANNAAAAPNEIKIFTDELANYGEHTLETHVNKASRAGPRIENRRTPLQVMPEYSYGIRHDWEFSLQLPAAFGQDASRLEGYRAELQYVAPHDEDGGFYWGVNFELARVEHPGDASFWNIELIPILGYRTDRWHFVANPGIDKAVSGASRCAIICLATIKAVSCISPGMAKSESPISISALAGDSPIHRIGGCSR